MVIVFLSIAVFLVGFRLTAMATFPTLVGVAWFITRKHPRMFQLWGHSLNQKATMTRVNPEQSRLMPWYAKAGAASSIVPLSRWVAPNVFALRPAATASSPRSPAWMRRACPTRRSKRAPAQCWAHCAGCRKAPACTSTAVFCPAMRFHARAAYGDPVLDAFVDDRLEYLNSNAGFAGSISIGC